MDSNMLIQTETSCYRMEGEVIGQGSFGYVRKARDLVTSEMVAVKVVSSSFLEMAANQINILKRLNQCNSKRLEQNQKMSTFSVLKFLGSHRSYNQFFIVTELYGISLNNFVKKSPPVDELASLKIFYSILEAMRPLRQCKILHRDLKPANILVQSQEEQNVFVSKICDFGLSTYQEMGKTSLFDADRVGTLIYQAPEILKFKEYSQKSQIWSLGIILYQLLFRRLPFNFTILKNVDEIYQKLMSDPIKFKQVSPQIAKIGEKCLYISSNKRIKFVDLIRQTQNIIKKLSQSNYIVEKNIIEVKAGKKIIQTIPKPRLNNTQSLKVQNNFIELSKSVSDFSTVQLSVDDYRNNRKISQQIFDSLQMSISKQFIINLSKMYSELKARLQTLKKPKQNSAVLLKLCQKLENSENTKQYINYFSPELAKTLLSNICKMQMILEYAQSEKQITFNLKEFMYVDTLMKLYEIVKMKNNNAFSAIDFSNNCAKILQQHLAFEGQAKSMQYYKNMRALALSIS